MTTLSRPRCATGTWTSDIAALDTRLDGLAAATPSPTGDLGALHEPPGTVQSGVIELVDELGRSLRPEEQFAGASWK